MFASFFSTRPELGRRSGRRVTGFVGRHGQQQLVYVNSRGIAIVLLIAKVLADGPPSWGSCLGRGQAVYTRSPRRDAFTKRRDPAGRCPVAGPLHGEFLGHVKYVPFWMLQSMYWSVKLFTSPSMIAGGLCPGRAGRRPSRSFGRVRRTRCPLDPGCGVDVPSVKGISCPLNRTRFIARSWRSRTPSRMTCRRPPRSRAPRPASDTPSPGF